VNELAFEPATSADFDAVLQLLATNHLPVSDVKEHLPAFTLAKERQLVVGSVGLESYARVSLLRSLCVAESHRGQGIGAALVADVLARAAAQGTRELYLLTTSAASYFMNFGFIVIARDQVPLEIRGTAQFTSLCPTSAVCMRKPMTACA
jgi:amino-acid N-acetyltransferase